MKYFFNPFFIRLKLIKYKYLSIVWNEYQIDQTTKFKMAQKKFIQSKRDQDQLKINQWNLNVEIDDQDD